MFCTPHLALSLQDLQTTNQILVERAGWSIHDINRVRQRLEESGKGGGLAAAAHPSPVVSLILSDVLGDPLDLIASGPTIVPSSSSAPSSSSSSRQPWMDAWRLIQDRLSAEQYAAVPRTVKTLFCENRNRYSSNCSNQRFHPFTPSSLFYSRLGGRAQTRRSARISFGNLNQGDL